MSTGSRKKRKGSASPIRPTTAKRAREATDNVYNPEIRISPSRAQSVFRGDRDPYNPGRQTPSSTSLPSSDDWVFRIKVVSSMTTLDDDVFKKAVQGLVKICFPRGILDELGLDVLERAMRGENAAEDRIAKMIEIYRAEMVHRVTWMLATYLDTPAKVETGVRSIIAACSGLHANVGENIVRKIASNLSQHAARDKRDPTLSSNVTSDVAAQSAQRGPQILADSNMVDSAWSLGPGEQLVDAEEPSDPLLQPQPDKQTDPHNKNISPTWRWDVDPINLSSAALTNAFKRPSDLFAFHALPISRDRLPPGSSRRELRHKMKSMLQEMPEDEYEKWVESFKKLHQGDSTMLIRVPPEPSPGGHRMSAATSAPISVQERRSKASQRHRDTECASVPSENKNRPADQASGPRTKEETFDDMSVVEDMQQGTKRRNDEELAKTTNALRELSTEDPGSGPVPRTLPKKPNARVDAIAQPGHSDIPTPIMDLLWGEKTFRAKDVQIVVETLMTNLSDRVPADSIAISRLDGSVCIQDKGELQRELVSLNRQRFRDACEWKLGPWVVAKLAAFPELQARSFVFVHILTSSTVVLDLFCDRSVPMMTLKPSHARKAIVEGVLKRLGPQYTAEHPYVVHLTRDIRGVLTLRRIASDNDDTRHRGKLEKVLRPVAFDHKDQFRDLAFSAPVKAWERLTGLKW